jgi:hypothetical protein
VINRCRFNSGWVSGCYGGEALNAIGMKCKIGVVTIRLSVAAQVIRQLAAPAFQWVPETEF